MLVLTRKEGEGVMIGNDVKITVSRIKGDKVKLGVEAPRSTKVIRSELFGKEKPTVTQNKDQLFETGGLVVTSNCLAKLDADGEFEETREFLTRHISGDWGNLCDEDKQVNKEALETGTRLMSTYKTSSGTEIWVITDAIAPSGHRETTTILLPEDY